MQRAYESSEDWPRGEAAGRVTLTYQDRYRRRVRLTSDEGEPFLLDLASATQLEEGDGLHLEDGRWLSVRAAEEAVLEVIAADGAELARWAWHLGNRHLPVQVLAPLTLRLLDDPVIGRMLEGLGASPRALKAPFSPERGAYTKERGNGHASGRSHGQGHGQHSHPH